MNTLLFCLVTWNIHAGQNLSKIVSELAGPKLSPCPIVHLQESEPDLTRDIAELLGYEFHAVGFDGILSRYPIQEAGAVLINPETGRQAAWATVTTPDRPLRLYTLHLSYKVKTSPFISKIREAEAKRILDHARDFQGSVVIAGDFNSIGKILWGHKERSIKALLAEGYHDALSKHDGATHKLLGRLDWIFKKGLNLIDSKRGNYAGSDHRWLRADFSTPCLE